MDGTDALFAQYIDVVNQAISENRDSLYGAALNLWSMAIGDEPIAVGVYDNDARQPHDWYKLRLDDMSFDLVEDETTKEAKYSWLIDDDHVSHVVGNPDEYIEEPLKLELKHKIELA